MKLHTASAHPDWQDVTPASRNIWQKIAAATHSVLTPGNILSLAGIVLVGIGLYEIYYYRPIFGLALVAVGRLADIADGWVADRTGTKSPMGEKVDATFDKIITFGALIVLVASKDLPLVVAICIAIITLVTSIVSLTASVHKRPLHPSRIGKYGMALLWVAIGLYVLADGKGIVLAYADLTAIAALCMAGAATYGYTKQAFRL